ncbi:MAG: LysM peptidoglycan-binding domain-containing protein [Candidatus Acidiferrales bacterium]
MGVAAGALVCVFSVAAPGFAQSVADAARQERERQQQKPCANRVYTNEDLSRPQILDAKDRACLEAAREAAPPAAAPFSANAAIRPLYAEPLPLQPVLPPFHLDSLVFPYESALPDFPLADIAPYNREMKAARLAREAQLQKTIVVSVPPGRSRLHAAAPAPGVAPSIPQFRLQPASFDTRLPPAPLVPSRSGDARARVETVPPVHIVLPGDGTPVASDISNNEFEIPSATIRVEPGDSLWKIAAQYLGDGREWRRIAQANPHIANPNLIHVGDVLQLPPSFEISNLKPESSSRANVSPSSLRATPAIRVVLGDTLWALARTQFGRGTAWTCIAQANQLPNPHLILPGQTLALPASCQ